jgi:predicted dehydrogenase
MAAPLRVGVIGAGANTRLMHIPRLQAIDGVEIAAVCNRSRESSERVATEFGIPRVAGSVEEIFGDPGIDAVCIGTWPYRHRDYTVAALGAGKHVLCEARMACDAKEAEEMLAAARARPHLVAQLVPAPFDLRLGPTIRRLVDEGPLGDITEAHVTVANGSGLDASAPLHWRHRTDYSGRNVMMLGIYNEILQRWLGDTRRVMAHGRISVRERPDPETGAMRPVDIPDSYGVLAELANGARAAYALSAVAAGAPFNGIAVYGTKATLRWTPDDTATLIRHRGEPQPLAPDPGTDRGWQVEADFVDSIRTGAPVRYTSLEDGVRYMRFVDACWTSWQEGRAVDLPA